MFLPLLRSGPREAQILEVVTRNGWDYLSQLLQRGEKGEATLPAPEVLCRILVELGPVYVKLGQLLSTRPDLLPPDYTQALGKLQANVPAVDWSAIEPELLQGLGKPLEQVFSEIAPTAVSAGSIGQVHKATLLDGTEVAVKVRRPGIVQVVEEDTQLIRAIAQLVAETSWGKYYDTVGLAQEFSQSIRRELDFRTEASNTRRIRQELSASQWYDTSKLLLPQVFDVLSSETILVLEWISGTPILKADLQHQELDGKNVGSETARIILRAFIQQMFLDGFFDADPHPGNFFYLGDGKVVLLDLGMVGCFDPRTRQALLDLILALVSLDPARSAEIILEVAPTNALINFNKLTTDVDQIIRKYFSLSLEEFNFAEFFYDVLQVARSNQIRVPGSLGLFAKAIANLEGLAHQLAPDFNFPNEIKPLMTSLFERELKLQQPLNTSLQLILDVRRLLFHSPRQVSSLLKRFSSEAFEFNIQIRDLITLSESLDRLSKRLSFSILVSSLTLGAAILAQNEGTPLISTISKMMFLGASVLGFWLLISILRRGDLHR
jgi:predicted unusual protein kinase regulating ubiquinone biosynthesis (AarF/ABC1/UbiB family)